MNNWFDKIVRWSSEKNDLLIKERWISFEDIIIAVTQWAFYKIESHLNKENYPNQLILYVHLNNYIYAVPFVESENEIFLKTIFKSRKDNKRFKNLINN